ncbi:MAG: PilN domain-containing protein [bacterium]|nr:PilN domain-containing protein [bacterium]
MSLNLINKKNIYGVSVTPDIGIEVAQIDYEKGILLNYLSKPFEFDTKMQNTSFDLDIFKEVLHDALLEIGAPQGSEIILTLPTAIFNVKDWPASMDTAQIINNIEDEIAENPLFQNEMDEPIYDWKTMPNSTIQFNKIVYTALNKSLVTEIAIQIQDLKYKLVAIDTSLNACLNALIYSNRVEVDRDTVWVMLVVENNCCRIVTMQGRIYVDCIEEKINIGKVLEDAENYDVVVNAVRSILKNTPSSMLYVLSKTDLISAKILADKLQYKSQIVHMEANMYASEPLLELAPSIAPEAGKLVSLDVVGAAIRKDYGDNSVAQFNMFNKLLGDIYTSQVPPVFKGIELSIENMLKYGIAIAIVLFVAAFSMLFIINKAMVNQDAKLQKINEDIAAIDKFLEENKDISSNKFSEPDEIKSGLIENKHIYSYYTIVGTEIPKKLWLTSLDIGQHITITGQADNLESVYSFYRNIKDYNPSSEIKLQKLGLAGKSIGNKEFSEIEGDTPDTDSILTSLNADFYEFRISDIAESAKKPEKTESNDNLPNNLEPIEE